MFDNWTTYKRIRFRWVYFTTNCNYNVWVIASTSTSISWYLIDSNGYGFRFVDYLIFSTNCQRLLPGILLKWPIRKYIIYHALCTDSFVIQQGVSACVPKKNRMKLNKPFGPKEEIICFNNYYRYTLYIHRIRWIIYCIFTFHMLRLYFNNIINSIICKTVCAFFVSHRSHGSAHSAIIWSAQITNVMNQMLSKCYGSFRMKRIQYSL